MVFWVTKVSIMKRFFCPGELKRLAFEKRKMNLTGGKYL
jgi:hypothetical protein